MEKRGFTITFRSLRLPNSWLRDIVSEILSTYVFVLFAIGVVAQETLRGLSPASMTVINLSASLGLTMAIYVGGNSSGGYVNPGIALSMCLTGYLKWKKYPVYVVCHFIGAFLASATVFEIYYDAINAYDGGQRQVVGVNGTASIFTSLPNNEFIDKGRAFLEVMIGHALLVGCTLAILDSRNMGVSSGLSPIPIGLSVYPICSAFGNQTGCPINATKDLAPRVMLTLMGYDSGVWSYWDYWFWMPPVANFCGSILAVILYQVLVSIQIGPPPTMSLEIAAPAHPDDAPELTNYVVSKPPMLEMNTKSG